MYYDDWNTVEQKSAKAIDEAKKNLFGLLFSAKAFINQMTPHELGEIETEPFYSFTTPEYTVHYHETMSGLRFVVTTDPSVTKLAFDKIYSIYITHVVKNPTYNPETVTVPILLSLSLPPLSCCSCLLPRKSRSPISPTFTKKSQSTS